MCTPLLSQETWHTSPLPFFWEHEIIYMAAVGYVDAPALCVPTPTKDSTVTYMCWRCAVLHVAPHTDNPSDGCRLLRASSREDVPPGLGSGCSVGLSDLVWLLLCSTPRFLSIITTSHAAFILLYELTPPFLKSFLAVSWLLFNLVILSKFIVTFPLSIIIF